MLRVRELGAGAACMLSLSGVAAAGPDWCEMGDAGSFTSTAAVPGGIGTLFSIGGALGGPGPASDFEDMYRILIVDPVNFYAMTVPGPQGKGATDFDSVLWLFDSAGRAILANDEVINGSEGSVLEPAATDATGFVLTTPGIYYLAITSTNPVIPPTNQPLAAGLPMFQFLTRDEISGPDGPGATLPHDAWTGGGGQFGWYVIELCGVEFSEVPAPGAAWVLALAGMACARRRR